MHTQGPSLTKSFAAANPIPVVPPVMTATFPFNLPSGFGISFNVDIKNNQLVTSSAWAESRLRIVGHFIIISISRFGSHCRRLIIGAIATEITLRKSRRCQKEIQQRVKFRSLPLAFNVESH